MPRARPALRKIAARKAAEYGTTEAAVQADLAEAKTALEDFAERAAETNLAGNAASSGIAAMASLTYSGAVGDFTSSSEVINLQGKFLPIPGTDPEDYGSPLRQRVQINTLSGFVLCDHPHMQLFPGMITEAETIESFMVMGFFYE
jgi:hypothetical protein